MSLVFWPASGPVARNPMFVIITRSIMTRYIVAAICVFTNDTGAESDHGYESNQY
jgi:hypothetical protein